VWLNGVIAATETRAAIKQAALDVFRENGYERTTVRGIAERAGVTLSTLYTHIGSKEKLFLELVQPVIERPTAAMQEIATSSLSPAEKLRASIVAAASTYDEYFPELFMYFNDFYPALDRLDPSWRFEYESMWLDIITAGIEQGLFRAGLDPGLVRYQMLGMIAWMHKWYTEQGSHTAIEIGEQFADVALKGLLA
jgi:TetR/AcrR family transcriptional regulator, cholesterol catabolism regulator